MAILEVKNIKKGFGSVDVLRGVSFSLEKGQVLAIIGSSGSGKTTLLRCLNFLETPDEGEIRVDGKLLNDGSLTEEQIRQNRLHFGLVFQNFNLFPQYTVLENVMLAPKLLKKGNPGALKEKALKLLDQVGLLQKQGSYPYQLSGGQQQRVAIARALALKPDILCFDEPTSALDPIATNRIEELLLELKKEFTIIIVTHNMSQAARISDYSMFMYLGELIEYDKTRIMFTNPRDKRTEEYLTGQFG